MPPSESDNQIVIAMDHARAMGAVQGLDDPGRVLEQMIEAGADAVMTSFGVVKRYRDQIVGRLPVHLRLDGGPSLFREDWLKNSAYRLLHSIDDAQALGVDGVCLMCFVGAPCELETLENVAEIAGECLDSELSVMVEALPCPCERIPDPLDVEAMASACRIGFEHGADVIKTYYTGSAEGFRTVVERCPAPVLIAGGPRQGSDVAVLAMVAEAMAAGAKGVVFGRNIWQHPRPGAMVRALRAVIHDGARPAEAAELLRG